MSSTWERGERPVTIAIMAMGGEGGGVLSNWIVSLAEQAGLSAQNTSVPGVAQRTGATIYYAEFLPAGVTAPTTRATRQQPVFATTPAPGEVDIVIASELMEAARAVERGFVTSDRTTLIASTNRVYTIAERSSPGDGRVDSRELLDQASRSARQLIAGDFAAAAEREGSHISAALFGALAGSGELPFSRDAFEVTVRESGRGAERSLAAFAAGFEMATAAAAPARAAGGPVAVTISTSRPRTAEEEAARAAQLLIEQGISRPESLVGPALALMAAEVKATIPPRARAMVLLGCERTAIFQDLRYTESYLDRVKRFLPHDADPDSRLTAAAARHIGLWMCYQDTIYVAQQKTRRARLDRVRAESKAGQAEPVIVREYLHPGLDEIVDTLPAPLASRLARSAVFARLISLVAGAGITLRTNSVFGYLVLSTLARLRPMRRRSSRFGREQQHIDEWIELGLSLASGDYELGCETLECSRVLKGYGSTHQRGSESLAILLAAAAALEGRPEAGKALARLRAAALADDSGAALAAALEQEFPGGLKPGRQPTSAPAAVPD